VAKIYNDYKDHADFLTIYVREAHPTDEWQMKSNVKDDVCYAQPKNLEQRVAIANDFIKRYSYPVPFGIDDMTNAANDAYSAWPERLYVIDESGHVVYRGGMGPFNYYPAEVRAWLAARYGEVTPPKPEPASTAPGTASPSPSSPSPAPETATPAPTKAAPTTATPAPASPKTAPANTTTTAGKS
jgi:cell division septation protein DedD